MLKTKLNKPNPSSKLIFRKELIDKLENGKDKKLTLGLMHIPILRQEEKKEML